MTEVGARDRLVMAGLVVLGLLTVIAGVLSGRSTINYVLTRDARQAALSWAGDINTSLGELGPHAPQLLDQSLEVLDAEKFASQAGKPAGQFDLRGRFHSGRGPRAPDYRLAPGSILPVAERIREQARRFRRARRRRGAACRRRQSLPSRA